MMLLARTSCLHHQAILAILVSMLVAGCEETHKVDCSSLHRAAREWFTKVTGESASNYTFKAEEWGNDLVGFRISDEGRGKFHSMALRKRDCSLDYIKVDDTIE